MGGWGFFLQQVPGATSTDLVDTAAYDVSGWGATGGAEFGAGNLGAFGLTLSLSARHRRQWQQLRTR
jgi:hypothetical protein